MILPKKSNLAKDPKISLITVNIKAHIFENDEYTRKRHDYCDSIILFYTTFDVSNVEGHEMPLVYLRRVPTRVQNVAISDFCP